ncbi:MAG: 6-bladed beta-propeller [Dehalococcoidia bacterium]|nr:6-bladed beta-propeller [Dehalococcoidia bacterium]MSQ34823.1 6-bladed beta-propeller [Dehalococcoidia bacterium]
MAARTTRSSSKASPKLTKFEIVGTGDYRYQLDDSWPKLPEFWEFTLCSDVAVDSDDKVWVFSRGRHPVSCWTPGGKFIGSWGEGEYRDPHGIFIDVEDNIWLTDTQLHIVEKRTQDGRLLLQLGERGHSNPTVSQKGDNGKPFNMPSGVSIAKSGDIFVSDGYGNRRVHRFSAKGELKNSWGRSGDGPGEFALLHNIGIDSRGRVFICDRENSRIQIFDQDGKFLKTWSDVLSPGDVYFGPDNLCYVAEQGRPTGVSVFDLDGKLVSRFRGGPDGVTEAPHGIWADSKGDVYVAEIGQKGHGQRVRKFVRV